MSILGIFLSCEPEITYEKPIIETSEVSNVTESTVDCGGLISSDQGSLVSARGICWSTNPNPTVNDSKTEDAAGTGAYTSKITGLTPSTTYYVRAYATNKGGTSYGLQVTFTTKTLALTSVPAYFVMATTAMTGGMIASNGDSIAIISRGVCWNTFPNPTIDDSCTVNGSGKGTFNTILNNLKPGTTYFVRAYVTNSVSTYYGNEISFTTQDGVAKLTTSAAASIKTATATIIGNVTEDGGDVVSSRGICWSTNQNPTIENFKTASAISSGYFTCYLNGLTANTTYYARAYASNNIGTFYGNEISFTTTSGIASLTTANATSISNSSFVSGGTITTDGGATITERGICWSESQNPTILDSKKSNGNDIGTFTASASSLTPLTTYYVRSYAINSCGTHYGNQISVTTAENDPTKVVDIDGNEYSTVKIGTQLWMASNLKTTKYRNGDPIVNMTDYTVWVTLTSGAYCDYDNLTSNGNVYGHLYNWYAVNDSRNIAPVGWHIPSDAEWDVLVAYLGGSSIAGGKMKETGTAHWWSPNLGATNESGFTALPGGGSNTRGWNINVYGFWWSSTEYNSTQAWYRYLYKDDTNIVRAYNNSKTLGYSIRCIKD